MMRKFLLVSLLVLAGVLALAFDITENTAPSIAINFQTISAEATALSSAISMKGYERIHILAPYAFSATTTSVLEVTIYEATGTSATFAETASSTAAPSSSKYGFIELEWVKDDFDYPYIKLELTNNASPATVITGIMVIKYGATHAPF